VVVVDFADVEPEELLPDELLLELSLAGFWELLLSLLLADVLALLASARESVR
jgi:hypothetical protein